MEERILSPSRDSLVRVDDMRAIDRTIPPERTGLVSRTVSNFESGSNAISDRYVPEVRQRAGERILANDYQREYEEISQRYLPESRTGIAERSIIDRVIESYTPSTMQDKTLAEALSSYYNPLSMTAGSGLNASGGIGVIPGGEIQSSNSNTLLIFLVVGIGILAGWFYYQKVYKKGGAND